MQFYWLVLGILGVWRMAHLLSAEDGPWDVFARLRRIAGNGFWGKLLDCFYCLSLWVAAPFALWIGETPKEMALLWLGLSSGAILLERVTQPRTAAPPAIYFEHPKEEETPTTPETDRRARRPPDPGSSPGSAGGRRSES